MAQASAVDLTATDVVGVPKDYPVATAIVNGLTVYLRPLKNPLYDTELMVTANAAVQVQFFVRSQGQTTAAGALTKGIAETNLRQSGQLASPLHFKVYGFVVKADPTISLSNWNNIFQTGAFTFLFSGNRIYLQVPLQAIPAGSGPTGAFSTTQNNSLLSVVTNGIAHVNNIYRFEFNGKMLMIRPTENFGVNFDWATAPTQVALNNVAGAVTSVRLATYIYGVYYTSL